MSKVGLVEDRAASDMLEDALHHFDDIIDNAATSNIDNMEEEGDGFSSGLEGVALLMEDLRNAVEATLDAEVEDHNSRVAFSDALLQFISPDTLNFYRRLLKIKIRSTDDADKLRCENESLMLQVNVLSDQVDLQSEKLSEVEAELRDALNRLAGADARLQEEVSAKTSLETEKLRLLNEVSNCKIAMAQRQRQEEMEESNRDKHSQALKQHYDQEVDSLRLQLEAKDSLIVRMRQQLNEAVPRSTLKSPDEGFVGDEPVQNELHLHMPAPFATSTPLAQDSHPSKSEAVARDPVSKSVVGQDVEQREPEGLPADSSPLHNTATNSQNKSTKASSTPNLAGCVGDETSPDSTPTRNHFSQRKKHGFRKFFTSFKLRRSRSTSLENQNTEDTSGEAPFQRGGVRATTGGRLGWNPRHHTNQAKNPQDPAFQRWDSDRVCQWMNDIGLHGYVDACRKWVKSGDTLLRATNHELEKELGVRHPLHKKKLMLHLQSLGAGQDDELWDPGQMDGVWVARWLDDVGLPQYKDAFHEACMDGLLLHHLTIADAQKLKITNLFHLISLRRAIEKLRICEFDPGQLRRRPVPEGESEDVSLWTNHRVMEWLRTVDLAEYAPNLRGSGVHGALMVYEPMFSAETLASLLNIPISKSLLRRHLSTKLDQLLPQESVSKRKERTKEAGYQPLNIAIKYKVGRRSFGSFGRFRGASAGGSVREFSNSEYVCPMSSKKTMSQHRGALESKLSMQTQPAELDEKAAKELTAFSKEINTLTNKWTED